MGVPGRADRRAAVLPRHELERGAATPGGARSRSGAAASGSGAASPAACSSGSGSCAVAARTSRCSWTASRPACSSPRRSGAWATGSTRSCSAARPRCRGASRSTPSTARPATPTTRRSTPRSSTRSSGTSGSRRFLVWLGHHRRIRPPGLFALYVAGYSLGRIGEELLRVDPAHHIFGLRLNFFVAIALFLVGVIWFVRIQRTAATSTRIPIRAPRGRRVGRGKLRRQDALHRRRGLEDRRVLPPAAHDLQADRQAVVAEADRDRRRRLAGEVRGQAEREPVVEERVDRQAVDRLRATGSPTGSAVICIAGVSSRS